jgi:methylamine dehydrogenase heavy chain
MRKSLWRRQLVFGGLLALTLAPAAALAQVPEGAALGTQEDHPTRVLPEPQPHWVYVLEPVFPYLVASKVWILDGDTLEFKGMASAGYTANLVLSHDKSAFYVAETYWSRGSRGDRTDVVTTYDSKTLIPRAR